MSCHSKGRAALRFCDTPEAHSPPLRHSSQPQNPHRSSWLLQETSQFLEERFQRVMIYWAPFFLLLLLASSQQLSCPVTHTLPSHTCRKSNGSSPSMAWTRFLLFISSSPTGRLWLAVLSKLHQNRDVFILSSHPGCHFKKRVIDKYGATRL